MACLDVEGRTLKERTGKARVTLRPGDRLLASPIGYIPDPSHAGLSPQRLGIGRSSSPNTKPYQGVNSLAPEEPVRGRKHVEIEHKSLTDDSKRQGGRIGVRKVAQTASKELDQARPSTAPFRDRMRLLTAEQQAKKKLERIAETHSELRPVIADSIARGADVVVDMEKKIQKLLLLQEARVTQRAKSPEVSVRKSADLGTNSTLSTPFAIEGSKPLEQQHHTTHRKNFHRDTTINDPPAPLRFSKRLDVEKKQGSVPFDTMDSACYPEPPAYGAPIRQPQGKGHITYQPPIVNIDEELQKKATARCHYSGSNSSSSLVFSGGEPDKCTRKSLRQEQEVKCKGIEERNLFSRKGKFISEEKHRPTALW